MKNKFCDLISKIISFDKVGEVYGVPEVYFNSFVGIKYIFNKDKEILKSSVIYVGGWIISLVAIIISIIVIKDMLNIISENNNGINIVLFVVSTLLLLFSLSLFFYFYFQIKKGLVFVVFLFIGVLIVLYFSWHNVIVLIEKANISEVNIIQMVICVILLIVGVGCWSWYKATIIKFVKEKKTYEYITLIVRVLWLYG